jgi:choice-of-anchor C domain-containing protein
VLVLAACVFAVPAQAASVLANGSFETGPDPGAEMSLPPGSLVVGNWSVTRAGIRYAGTAWTAAQGARSIALNGADAGGIQQTFPTVAGAQYTLRLYMAGDPGTTPAVKTMGVSAAGQSTSFSKDITGMWAWDPGWDLRTFVFYADGDSTTIELYSTMTGMTSGPFVDSVSVTRTTVADAGRSAPGLALDAPAPNPTHGPCTLGFTLPTRAPARLLVYDLVGREIATLAHGELGPGRIEAAWDGRVAGRDAAPGLYLVSLEAAGARLTRRVLVVR